MTRLSIFFWAGHDPNSDKVYILAGDENSLTSLDAVLYTITASGISSWVQVANSKYTLSNLHVDQKTGIIYSVSHGLYGKNDWSIVVIDPQTGAVTLKSTIDYGKRWKTGNGGGVYNGLSDGYILHTFTWGITEATVLAVIEIETGKVAYVTDVNLGVNSEMKLSYVVAL